MDYELLFVGAGPAGITGGYVASMCDVNFVMIEAGSRMEDRDRFDPGDCVHGEGGAGLFSDGKFSFYPSGTRLWDLKRELLEEAYGFVQQLHPKFPSFPTLPTEKLEKAKTKTKTKTSTEWGIKPYPSIYLTLTDRERMITRLTTGYQDRIRFSTRVVDIGRSDTGYSVTTLHPDRGREIYTARKLVVGGGRFIPLLFPKLSLRIPMEFFRVELGVRVEGSSTNPLYTVTNLTDPKFSIATDQYTVKTFCWCRNGETSRTEFKTDDGTIITYSGRADFHDTERSNFGFNLVFHDPSSIRLLRSALATKPFEIGFINSERTVPDSYAEVYSMIRTELGKFFDYHRITDEEKRELVIKGPTIEGVGDYPITDENMVVPGEQIYVCGDGNGKFRGLIPSMVSGGYAVIHSEQN